jgi:hypothetical protein
MTNPYGLELPPVTQLACVVTRKDIKASDAGTAARHRRNNTPRSPTLAVKPGETRRPRVEHLVREKLRRRIRKSPRRA